MGSLHSHTHDDDHAHGHEAGGHLPANQRLLLIAFAATAAFFAAELIGGYVSNSLALLSDAAHMLTDMVALGMALVAAILVTRGRSARYSFGLYRVEVLVAFLNGIFLLFIVGKIVWEAFERLQVPAEVESTLLLWVAGGGLLVNVAIAWMLHEGSETNLNVRAAFLHVLGDLLGSVAAITSGVVIKLTGNTLVDTVASIIVALLVLFAAVRLIRDTGYILLEASPVTPHEVAELLAAQEGVESVHDVHVWTITPGVLALTAHLIPENLENPDHDKLLGNSENLLRERFAISHTTIQIETRERCEVDADAHAGCSLDVGAADEVDQIERRVS